MEENRNEFNKLAIVIFFKLIISVRCGHCDISPPAPKILAMPLYEARVFGNSTVYFHKNYSFLTGIAQMV